jgi:hypothetical protein
VGAKAAARVATVGRLRDLIEARRAARPRLLVRAALALMHGSRNNTDPTEFANLRVASGVWWDTDNVGEILSPMRRGNLRDQRAAELWITKADPLMMDPAAVKAGSEFLEWAYPTTIVGQLARAHRVEFSTGAFAQTFGAIAGWVGENQAKPVTETALDNVLLPPRKVAVLTAISAEIIERADENAEQRIGNALKGGVEQTLDATFASADSEVADVSPAGIFYGAPTVSGAGSSTANMVTDFKALFAKFDADVSLRSAVLLMRPEAAIALTLAGLATNNSLGVNGGTLLGLPVIVSSSVSANTIGLLASEYVALALGDVVTLDTSRDATLDMTGGNAPDFDAFSRNAVALRAELFANWSLAGGPRDSNGDPLGAALLTNASYA